MQMSALEPVITWTKDCEERLGYDAIPTYEVTGDKTSWLDAMKKHFAEDDFEKKLRRHGFSNSYALQVTDPDCKAIAQRLVSTYAIGKEPASLGDAGALLSAPYEAMIGYLLSRGGVVHLANVLVAATGIECVNGGGVGGSFIYFEKKAMDRVYHRGVHWMVATALSTRLDDEARAVLRKAYDASGLALRVLYTRALADKELGAECARAFLAAKKNELNYDAPRQIFDIVFDIELLTKLAKRHPSDAPIYRLIKEYGALATDAVIARHDKDPNNEWIAEALAMIESVPAAKQLAESLAKKRAAGVAKAYFERRPDLAVLALEPLLEDARMSPFVRPILDAKRAPVEKKPEAKVGDLPLSLSRPPPLKKSVTLPEWASPASLPQVLLKNGTALPPAGVTNLLLTLTQSDASLKEIKEACDRTSLRDFAWALFEGWIAAGGTAKIGGWAFTALGRLGDDEVARKLAPLIRAWPGEGGHARAVMGLDVLATIGTDVALMHLHGIAQKVKFKGLQQKAKNKMDELAGARGLSAEELADRLVPDLGLEENGTLVLDFGPRKFTVGFDEELKPFVFDEKNKRSSDLPKPKQSDDAAKAKEATDRWKTLKKDAKAVASLQITRLELAMCGQRRWAPDAFQTFIVEHPLVVHLARRLVWGEWKGDKLVRTFRVGEGRELVNSSDEPVKLSKDVTIGIAHRFDLTDKDVTAWGEQLANYQILQPFDQLGRALFEITAAEKTSAVLARLGKIKVKTGKILGLEIRGWRKGPPQDAGWVYEMRKRMPGGFDLCLPIDGGLCMGWSEGTPSEQGIESVTIEREGGKKATFGDLSRVAFSELVRELETLRD